MADNAIPPTDTDPAEGGVPPNAALRWKGADGATYTAIPKNAPAPQEAARPAIRWKGADGATYTAIPKNAPAPQEAARPAIRWKGADGATYTAIPKATPPPAPPPAPPITGTYQNFTPEQELHLKRQKKIALNELSAQQIEEERPRDFLDLVQHPLDTAQQVFPGLDDILPYNAGEYAVDVLSGGRRPMTVPAKLGVPLTQTGVPIQTAPGGARDTLFGRPIQKATNAVDAVTGAVAGALVPQTEEEYARQAAWNAPMMETAMLPQLGDMPATPTLPTELAPKDPTLRAASRAVLEGSLGVVPGVMLAAASPEMIGIAAASRLYSGLAGAQKGVTLAKAVHAGFVTLGASDLIGAAKTLTRSDATDDEKIKALSTIPGGVAMVAMGPLGFKHLRVQKYHTDVAALKGWIAENAPAYEAAMRARESADPHVAETGARRVRELEDQSVKLWDKTTEGRFRWKSQEEAEAQLKRWGGGKVVAVEKTGRPYLALPDGAFVGKEVLGQPVPQPTDAEAAQYLRVSPEDVGFLKGEPTDEMLRKLTDEQLDQGATMAAIQGREDWGKTIVEERARRQAGVEKQAVKAAASPGALSAKYEALPTEQLRDFAAKMTTNPAERDAINAVLEARGEAPVPIIGGPVKMPDLGLMQKLSDDQLQKMATSKSVTPQLKEAIKAEVARRGQAAAPEAPSTLPPMGYEQALSELQTVPTDILKAQIDKVQNPEVVRAINKIIADRGELLQMPEAQGVPLEPAAKPLTPLSTFGDKTLADLSSRVKNPGLKAAIDQEIARRKAGQPATVAPPRRFAGLTDDQLRSNLKNAKTKKERKLLEDELFARLKEKQAPAPVQQTLEQQVARAAPDETAPGPLSLKEQEIYRPTDPSSGQDPRWPGAEFGGKTVIVTASGEEMPIRYMVAEAHEPVPSHFADGTPNPKYGVEGENVQNRNREAEGPIVQMASIKGNPDYRRLSAAPGGSEGAPILRMDRTAVTNGRTAGIRAAYEEGNAGNYRTGLLGDLKNLGFSDEQAARVSQMKAPALYRVMEAPPKRTLTQFAQDLNVGSGLKLTSVESGRSDASVMAHPENLDRALRVMGLYRVNEHGDISTGENKSFVAEFTKAFVHPNERGGVFKDDTVTPDGEMRVRAAMLAAAYGDSPLVERILTGTDEASVALRNALVNVAPRMAAVRLRQQAGELLPVDVTTPMKEAADFIHRARVDGKTVHEALSPAVGELIPATEGMTPQALDLVRFVEAHKTKGRIEVTRLLDSVAGAAEEYKKLQDGGLFGTDQAESLKQTPPTLTEVYNAARDIYAADSADRRNSGNVTLPFGQPEPEPPGPAGPGVAREGNREQLPREEAPFGSGAERPGPTAERLAEPTAERPAEAGIARPEERTPPAPSPAEPVRGVVEEKPGETTPEVKAEARAVTEPVARAAEKSTQQALLDIGPDEKHPALLRSVGAGSSTTIPGPPMGVRLLDGLKDLGEHFWSRNRLSGTTSQKARIERFFGASGFTETELQSERARVRLEQGAGAGASAAHLRQSMEWNIPRIIAGVKASGEALKTAGQEFRNYMTGRNLEGIKESWKTYAETRARQGVDDLVDTASLRFDAMIADAVRGGRGFELGEDGIRTPAEKENYFLGSRVRNTIAGIEKQKAAVEAIEGRLAKTTSAKQRDPNLTGSTANQLRLAKDALAREAEGLRRVMVEIGNRAHQNVKIVDVGNGQTLDEYGARPEVRKAIDFYKEHVGSHLQEAHAMNNPIWATNRGKEGYFPLTGIDRDTTGMVVRRRAPFAEPNNPGNFFTTGLHEYDTSAEAFQGKARRAIKMNTGASYLQAMKADKMMLPVPEGGAPETMVVNGNTVPTHVEAAKDSYMILSGGKLQRIPGESMYMPEPLYREAKRVFFNTDPEKTRGAWDAIASGITAFNLGGPTDAVFHSMNLWGTFMLRAPYVGTDIASKLASHVPVLRELALGMNLAWASPESVDGARRYHELNRLALLGPRIGEQTTSLRRAQATESEYFLRKPWTRNENNELRGQLPITFGAMIYGPDGIDVRGRILIDKLGEDMARGSAERIAKKTGRPVDEVFKELWSDKARIDWNHMLGNYTFESEGTLMRALKSSGFAPFATAGITMNINGILGTFGLGGKLPVGKGLGNQMLNRYRATLLWNLAFSNVVAWATANKMVNDKWPWEDDNAKVGWIRVPDKYRETPFGRKLWGDNLTKHGWVNIGFTNPLFQRSLRITGVRGLLEGYLGKAPGDRSVDQAVADIASGIMHPMAGPTAQQAFRTVTGHEPSLRPSAGGGVEFRKPKVSGPKKSGLEAIWEERIKGGFVSANPMTRRMAEAKEQEQPGTRVAVDTVVPGLIKGPFKIDSPLERESLAYYLTQAPQYTEERAKVAAAKTAVRDAVKAGDLEKAKAVVLKAHDEINLSPTMLHSIVASANKPAYVTELREANLPTFLRIFKLGRPEERALLLEELVNKIKRPGTGFAAKELTGLVEEATRWAIKTHNEMQQKS